MAQENDQGSNSFLGQLAGSYAKDQANRLAGGFISSLAKQGVKKAGIAFLWPAILVIVGASVVLLIIVFFFGSPGIGANLTNPQTQTGSQTTPVSTSEISGFFNITGANSDQQNEILNDFSTALSYPTYKKLLTEKGIINIIFVSNLPYGDQIVDGYVDSNDTIKIRSEILLSKLKYTLLHESGHILSRRNGRIWQSYRDLDYPDLLRSNSSCYISGFLITYPIINGVGLDEKFESFAESISVFLMPRPPLENFSQRCKNTHDWFLVNIFGGNTQ